MLAPTSSLTIAFYALLQKAVTQTPQETGPPKKSGVSAADGE